MKFDLSWMAWTLPTAAFFGVIATLIAAMAVWERLAPGGLLAGVVPDARFTFDWRQPAWSCSR